MIKNPSQFLEKNFTFVDKSSKNTIMEKALAFRFLSDRLPVLDVQYGRIVDGHFQPFENMFDELDRDLPHVALTCVVSDVLGTQLLLKAKDFGTILYSLYCLDHSPVSSVETFPSFIVFHLKFLENEQKEEIEEAR